METIQIILADDHSMFRKGMRAIFKCDYPDFAVTGEAESDEALFRLLAAGTPADLVLLGINLPGGMGGDETVRRLRGEYPDLKILAISAENTQETVHAMLKAGIHGFTGKQQSSEDELANAIRSVAGGLVYFGRDISYILYDVIKAKSLTQTAAPDFSARELDVIRLCREGLTGKEIADRLVISPHIVATCKSRIFAKIGLNSTIEMVNYAMQKGIIQL